MNIFYYPFFTFLSVCAVLSQSEFITKGTLNLVDRVARCEEKLKLQENDIRQLKAELFEYAPEESKRNIPQLRTVAGASTTYIRWGRFKCPTTSETVYTGYASGSHYSHVGGGANYVCMTNTPTWQYSQREYDASKSNWVAYIYGVEYEFVPNWPFKGYNIYGGNIFNHDVPCAACKTVGRSSVLMIPGTYKCPRGWAEEYRGFLSAVYHGAYLH